MARKPKNQPTSPNVDKAVLRRVTTAMIEIDEQKAELSSDRSEYSTEAKEAGIHARAHRMCLTIAKMAPADRHLMLECFDAYRELLKLDAWQSATDPQSDIEDAAKAKAA